MKLTKFTLGLAAAVFLSGNFAQAFTVKQIVDGSTNPIADTNGNNLAIGSFTIKVGYFNFDTANWTANNDAIRAAVAAGDRTLLESRWISLFTADLSEGPAPINNGDGVYSEEGGPGIYLTQFHKPDSTWTSSFSQFSGKQMYAWTQLKSDLDQMAIFTDDAVRFSGGTNELTDAESTLSLVGGTPTLQVLAGQDNTASTGEFRLEAIPEPSSFLLVSLGMAAASIMSRRRRQA
jgi:hypothetical protein